MVAAIGEREFPESNSDISSPYLPLYDRIELSSNYRFIAIMLMIHGLVLTSIGHVLVDLVKRSETNMLFSGTTGMEKIKLIVMLICVQTILVTVRRKTNVITMLTHRMDAESSDGR